MLLEKGQKVGLLEQFFLAFFQLALFVLKSLADSLRRGSYHIFSSFQLFSLFMINCFFQAGFLLAKIRRILLAKRVNAAENGPDSAIILLKVCNMADKKS